MARKQEITRKTVMSVTPWLPAKDATYAGHKFYFEYLSVLARRFDVTVVAPFSEQNRAQAAVERDWGVVLVPAVPRRAGLLAELDALRLQGRAEQVPDIAFFLSAMQAPPDVVELNWSAVITLAPLVRRLVPTAYISAVQHDRYSSTLQWPRLSHLRLRGRVRDSVAGKTIALQERALVRSCDLVAGFKETDVRFAQALGPSTVVLDPWVAPVPVRHPSKGHKDVLFVAAFDRPENAQGALWLIEEVWPRVKAAFPDARLVLCGANPSPRLLAKAAEKGGDDVVVTGYVEDLGPYYAAAHCCVAPIFAGGGLRFKVAQAMCCAVPVVATPEALAGMEGIPSGDLEAVSTEPRGFAEGICRALAAPAEAAQRGQRLKAWAEGRFSFEAKVRTMMDHYELGRTARSGRVGAAAAGPRADLKAPAV